MESITFDISKAKELVSNEKITQIKDKIFNANDKIKNKTGEGSDFLGWVNLPENYDKDEFERIKKAAQKIRSNSDALIVIGIGGSYLGARAVIEALKPNFYNEQKDTLKIYFAGQNISGQYLNDLLNVLEDKNVSVNVISKSGTTTEPAIAFRVFKKFLEEKYGKKEAKERIFITTDIEKGALKTLAQKEGYESFIIPDDIGGRYSVLTAVGLLPIAAAGIDIDELVHGAKDGMVEYSENNINNPACLYAAVRNTLYDPSAGGDKKIEILVNYEPSMIYFAEWWKQLFGESEGKDGKGIFPASMLFTTDLHSMGQYVQDGERILFETIINIKKPRSDISLEKCEDDSDGLNYLAGKSVDYVNKNALLATAVAHQKGGVPNMCFNIPEINPYYIGKLIYLLERACAISAYALGVNPFSQPGVEEYKNNMFALLGKPGYDDRIMN